MIKESETTTGVWVSLKRILDALLATARNRVELFAVELQVEKCRLVEALLWAAAVVTFAMMTLVLVTLTVVVLFWENGRLLALAGLSVSYFIATVLAWRSLRSRLNAKGAFAGTLEELKKDRACLRPDN